MPTFSPIDSLLLLGMRVRVGQFTKAMARLHHTVYLYGACMRGQHLIIQNGIPILKQM